MYSLAKNICNAKCLLSGAYVKSKRRTIYSSTQEKMNLRGRNAIITGGCSPLGRLSAELLLTKGVRKIIIVDSDKQIGQQFATQQNKLYRKNCVKYINVDFGKLEDIDFAYVQAKKYFDGKFDIIFNNTSVTSEGNWENLIDVNIKTMVHSTLLGLRYMRGMYGKKEGVILNNASVCGIAALAGAPVYTASKHFILGFTRSLAMPYHHKKTKVRLLAICPGAVTISKTLVNGSPQLTPEMSLEFLREVNGLPGQEIESVANVVLIMIRCSDNGSLVVCEGNGVYGINVPSRKDMSIQTYADESGFSHLFRIKQYKSKKIQTYKFDPI